MVNDSSSSKFSSIYGAEMHKKMKFESLQQYGSKQHSPFLGYIKRKILHSDADDMPKNYEIEPEHGTDSEFSDTEEVEGWQGLWYGGKTDGVTQKFDLHREQLNTILL
ncbi:hypothetical protein FQR65_LT06807 [Abscondita terminalis]|nr:hypothetical protein FQR65_LT06807 [Abscondita terminalis]